jgi:hypothetical protein
VLSRITRLGDRVYFAVSRDEPRTLLVIPVDQLPDAIAHWGPAPDSSQHDSENQSQQAEGGQYPVQLARAGDRGGECYAAGCFS